MEFTELRGGLIVRTDALALYLALELRGHALTVKDGALLVSNGAALTAEERASIRACKNHLIAMVQYEAPEPI
jgi:hypothetical protein